MNKQIVNVVPWGKPDEMAKDERNTVLITKAPESEMGIADEEAVNMARDIFPQLSGFSKLGWVRAEVKSNPTTNSGVPWYAGPGDYLFFRAL